MTMALRPRENPITGASNFTMTFHGTLMAARKCMQKAMIMKLLKHMILDFETVSLVSTDDLIGEAGMSADEVRALKLSDAEWHKYDASTQARTRDAQRGASNAFPAPTNSHGKPTGMAACNGGQQVDALLSYSQYPAATGNSNPQDAYQPAPPTAPPSQAASGVNGAAPSAGGRGGAFANPSVTSSGKCLSFSAVRKTAIAYAPAARQLLQVHPRLQARRSLAWELTVVNAGTGSSTSANFAAFAQAPVPAQAQPNVSWGTTFGGGAPLASTSTGGATLGGGVSFGGGPPLAITGAGGASFGAGASFGGGPPLANASASSPAAPSPHLQSQSHSLGAPAASVSVTQVSEQSQASQAPATAATAPHAPAVLGTSATSSAVAEVVAPPVVEAVEDEVDSAPDSDDIEFVELVEYVVDKLSGGDEGVSNIRKNKLIDFIQDKDKGDWKNRDARANRAQLEELKDIEGGSGERGFRPQEMDMLLEILFKPRPAGADAAEKPATAKGRPRVTGRPKAHANFRYGEIKIIPSRQLQSYEDKGILKTWKEIEQFEVERTRKWGSNLTPLADIVKAIDDYGKQAEWAKLGDDYSVRPIQGATLPVSLRGYNLIATAETGSGKTMCFAVAALAAIDSYKVQPQVLIMAHNRTLLDQLCDEMDKLTTALTRMSDRPPITWSFVDRSDQQKSFNPTAHVILSTAGQLAGKIKKDLNVSGVKLLVGDEVDDILGQSSGAMQDILNGCERHARQKPQVLPMAAPGAGVRVRGPMCIRTIGCGFL